MHRRPTPRLIMITMISVLFALTSCSGPDAIPKASPLPGAPGGTLTIGIAVDNPGLGLKTADGYQGFDIDTARYVAEALGVADDHITWKEVTPANREQLLIDGRVDLVVSNYSITAERKTKIDFAGPYFVAHQDLLIRRNETDITSPETLNGRVLCSVRGTTSSAYIKQHYKGSITLKEYDRYSACVRALADSSVDAVTTDDVILAGFAAQPQYRGKLKVVGHGFTEEKYGIGVAKGRSQLVTIINRR